MFIKFSSDNIFVINRTLQGIHGNWEMSCYGYNFKQFVSGLALKSTGKKRFENPYCYRFSNLESRLSFDELRIILLQIISYENMSFFVIPRLVWRELCGIMGGMVISDNNILQKRLKKLDFLGPITYKMFTKKS